MVLIDNYDSFTYNLSQVRSRRTSRVSRERHRASLLASSRGSRPTASADLFFRLCRVSRTVARRLFSRRATTDSDDRPTPQPHKIRSQYLGDLGCDHVVVKNDEMTVDEIRAMNPKGVMVGPGPGTPEDSGIALDAVRELGPEFGVFGVCMGHQCIGQVFGGSIIRAPCGLMHGKSSQV